MFSMTPSLFLLILTFSRTDHFGDNFTDLLSLFELIQHTDGPPYIQGHTPELIISWLLVVIATVYNL